MSTICTATNLGRTFGTHTVLEGLSITLEPGEIVALTGPSGTGKSTALNILGLLEKPDRGTLSLFGESVPGPGTGRARRLLRDRLGYLFQNYALIDDDTAEANLRVAQDTRVRSATSRARSRAEVLARVGLASAAKQRVYELSGGEQQRLAIARLLLKPCDLILADEPTGSLDEANRDVVLGLLHELRDEGKTILIVTHDRTVARFCDREILLCPIG